MERKDKWTNLTKKVAPNEMYDYIVKYFNWVKTVKKDEHLVTESGFQNYLFEVHGVVINMGRMKKNNPEIADMLNIIRNKTVSTVESLGIFGYSGQGSVYTLILKNNGYEDKVINQNVEMPTFQFGNVKEEE